MQTDAINVANLKHAIETRDARTLASFYADNALVRIVDCDNPPSKPRELKGRGAIIAYYDDVCSRAITHSVECGVAQAVCVPLGCGDARLDPAEVCDDGNNVDGDGCSRDCRSTEFCGNGIVDVAVGEVCDDGNFRDGDGCSRDCRSLERCGNHIVDVAAGEVCDDGNNVDGDGCSASCKSTEVCGNGIVDVTVGEVCDDGNHRGGDGCIDAVGDHETLMKEDGYYASLVKRQLRGLAAAA